MRADPDAFTEYETDLLQPVSDRIVYTVLGNPLSYSAAVAFARCDKCLGQPGGVVIYHLSPIMFIDECAALAICDLVDQSQRNGRYVILSGLRDSLINDLDRARIFDRLSRSQCFEARRSAIEAAIAHCRTNGTTD